MAYVAIVFYFLDREPSLYLSSCFCGRPSACSRLVSGTRQADSFSRQGRADMSSITHLVGFALKLRNRGISDHGLIRELSSPLAGSLYSGEGHSRLYDDRIVYE